MVHRWHRFVCLRVRVRVCQCKSADEGGVAHVVIRGPLGVRLAAASGVGRSGDSQLFFVI